MTRYCPDTTVLLRLQDANALPVIASLSNCEFVLTDTVWEEATRKPGVGGAAKTILTGIAHVVRHDFMPNDPETALFAQLRTHYPLSKYHDGELSVIALTALHRDLVPVVFDRFGHVAACDELRRPVLTGHWFFSELHRNHGLSAAVLDDCLTLLHAKSYPMPTWHAQPSATTPAGT